MNATYAVMGNPVAHSLSPIIHHLFAEQTGCKLTYKKIFVDLSYFEAQVEAFFQHGGKGLNITLPFKERAFAMSNNVSPRCLEAMAANTLWMEGEKLQADNTDGVGLLRDISRHISLQGKKILVLGAGGAARGIIGPLLAAYPAHLTIANRTVEKAQILQQTFPLSSACAFADLANHLAESTYDIVINATSASLGGENIALPSALMATTPFCYDVAYAKKGATPFVAWARRFGCMAIDGLGMLVEQAAETFFIWHKVMPKTAPVLAYLQKQSS